MNMTHATEALKKYFGYDRFRPLQAEIIQAVYDKKHTIVLMPTGGGKSICFQVPAVTLPGTAVVVSPLIALMKDQVEALSNNGISAAFLNSSLTSEQNNRVEEALLSGNIKLLYVSPEKLVSQSFQPLLKRLQISLFAIDEAHCISAWGHDFRPEYTQLKFLKNQYPTVPIIALTATADKLTRKDMASQLGLEDPLVFIASFDRPNISLHVKPGLKRLEQIIKIIQEHPNQSGIIYCLSRRSCEELSEKLNNKGIRAAYYHAEVPPKIRAAVQDDFINDRIPVICATIAFGMGIDKSNVRFVIHYNMPRNLEGYYQEIGRAGRDGLSAKGILFFSYADVATYRDMIEQGDSDDVQKELKLAKLNRMYQFAEAPICRRKTVLYYFGEDYEGNCGNCDVCLNPPQQFDGTIAAQKALSAIMRTNQMVGMHLLVDILRGSNRREIFDNGFHKIKTYGAGREYSFDDWIYLISQLLHVGLVEIAYDDHNRLKVTESGKKVLFEAKQVQLATPKSKQEAQAEMEKIKATLKPPSNTQVFKDELRDLLMALRRALSQQQGVPPHLIFNDATIEDMVAKRPFTDADMRNINGMSERKLQVYGDAFMDKIKTYILLKTSEGLNVPGSTTLLTWDQYKKGKPIEQIAAERDLHSLTIMNHLATMYEKGELLDLSPWVSPEELDMIQGALPLFEEPYQMKPIYEHLKEKYNYDKIRWAIAHYRKKGRGAV